MWVAAIDVYFRYLDNSLITLFLNFTFMENILNQNVLLLNTAQLMMHAYLLSIKS